MKNSDIQRIKETSASFLSVSLNRVGSLFVILSLAIAIGGCRTNESEIGGSGENVDAMVTPEKERVLSSPQKVEEDNLSSPVIKVMTWRPRSKYDETKSIPQNASYIELMNWKYDGETATSPHLIDVKVSNVDGDRYLENAEFVLKIETKHGDFLSIMTETSNGWEFDESKIKRIRWELFELVSQGRLNDIQKKGHDHQILKDFYLGKLLNSKVKNQPVYVFRFVLELKNKEGRWSKILGRPITVLLGD